MLGPENILREKVLYVRQIIEVSPSLPRNDNCSAATDRDTTTWNIQGELRRLVTNFPRKGLRSKRRSSPCIFQVVASLSISSFLVILAADIRIRALACNTLKAAYSRKKFAQLFAFCPTNQIFSLLNLGNCCRQGGSRKGGGGNNFPKAKHFWPHYIFLAFNLLPPSFCSTYI